MLGFLYASTIAMVGLPVTVSGRSYAVWYCAGVIPTATLGSARVVPDLSVFTHAMHEAYFGDLDTEQTGRAYDVTLRCDAGLEAEAEAEAEADADATGKTPSTASTPTHTISRRAIPVPPECETQRPT